MLKSLGRVVKDICNQSIFNAKKRKGQGSHPRFLSYAVTWRCNSRCIMCDTWKSSNTGPGYEITPSELDSILKRDADFLRHLKKIGITGGEPFLRSNIVELIRVLRKNLPKTQISIVSNGFLTDKILGDLKEIKSFYPELQFSVSLDGIGEIHDKVRGVKGAYEKSIATLAGALKLGLSVTSGMTVSRTNINQIEAVAKLLDGMGVDFSFNLLEKGQNFHNNGLEIGLNPEEIKELIRILENYTHHFYMDNLRRLLLGKRRTLPCYAGIVSYFLKPNGELTICNLKGEPLGNICNESFSRVANSPRAKEIRLKYKNCSCWSQCEVKYSASSAPLSQAKWLLTHPEKKKVLKRYAPRIFKSMKGKR